MRNQPRNRPPGSIAGKLRWAPLGAVAVLWLSGQVCSIDMEYGSPLSHRGTQNLVAINLSHDGFAATTEWDSDLTLNLEGYEPDVGFTCNCHRGRNFSPDWLHDAETGALGMRWLGELLLTRHPPLHRGTVVMGQVSYFPIALVAALLPILFSWRKSWCDPQHARGFSPS